MNEPEMYTQAGAELSAAWSRGLPGDEPPAAA